MNKRRKKRELNKYKELIELIGEEALDKLAEELEVDYKVKKLKGKYMFSLLLYSILEDNRASLRTMEITYNRLYGDVTAHSSLQDRLGKIDPEFFKKIFMSVVEKAKLKLPKSRLKFVDATTIAASVKLLKFGLLNKNANYAKHTLKCTVLVGQGIPQDIQVDWAQKGSADDYTIPAIIRANTVAKDTLAVYVFDQGVKARKTYREFTAENIYFVSRIKETARIEIIETYSQSKKIKGSENLLTDQTVYLFNKRGKKTRIRLVTVKTTDGKLIRIITNLFDEKAHTITQIYHQRWSIEIFFKIIKQELNCKHFFGYNLNAAVISLYMVMTAAILLILYKGLSKIQFYRHARKALNEDIWFFLMEPVVERCGGNPRLIDSYRKKHPPIFCFCSKQTLSLC